MSTPADAPPDAPPPVEEAYRCPRCGAPHDPFQEYCLECGSRLFAYAPAGSMWRRDTWMRESPLWFWASFLALLLIALVAAAIVIAATDDDEPRRQAERTDSPQSISTIQTIPTDTTGAVIVPPPTTGAQSIPTLPTTTTTATTTTATTATTATTTTATETTNGSGGTSVISWPSNRTGYTVFLASVPQSRGRSVAEARAREAINRGLSQVGVINTSDYSSLRAGYYAVFTGIYDTSGEAQAGRREAVDAGYPLAYIREVVP